MPSNFCERGQPTGVLCRESCRRAHLEFNDLIGEMARLQDLDQRTLAKVRAGFWPTSSTVALVGDRPLGVRRSGPGAVEALSKSPSSPCRIATLLDAGQPVEAVRDADRLRDLPLTHPASMLQSQDFSNVPHRRSLGWHRISPRLLRGSAPVIRAPTARAAQLTSTGWPASIRTGGRHPSERVAGMRRNDWPTWVGIRTLVPEFSFRGQYRRESDDGRKRRTGQCRNLGLAIL